MKCKLKEWFRAWLTKEEKREHKSPCELCSLNEKGCPYK